MLKTVSDKFTQIKDSISGKVNDIKDNISEKYGAIELASGVVLAFSDDHVKYGGETGFENVLEALKFVVE